MKALPLLIGLAAMSFASVLAVPPATAPKDDTADWLLGMGTTLPATRVSEEPSSRPASPFGSKDDRGGRKGVLVLSNGERIPGMYATTRDKPIRVWDEKEKEYRDIPYNLIKSLEAEIIWERDEKEWTFKESGSDIKVYSGKMYPARELRYKVTLLNDQTVTGGIVAPLYLLTADDEKTFVLNKRQKGEVGETLKQLLYVKVVKFE